MKNAITVMLLSTSLMTTFASAQELNDDYAVMGTLKLFFDEQEHTLVIPRNKSNNRGGVLEREYMQKRFISVTASTVNSKGAPGSPLVNINFTADTKTDGSVDLTEFSYTDGQGYRKPMLAQQFRMGKLELTSFEFQPDGSVKAEFNVTVVRVDGTQDLSNPVVIETEAPIEMRGELAFSFKN